MHQKTTLPNGLRIVSSEIPFARSVSTSIFISAGSRHEPFAIQGISHFIEHMLFKGTERRPTAKEVSEAIESIGGIFNAESGKEATVFWNKVAAHHFPIALDVLSDLIRNSRFVAEEIEKERKVITEEISTLFDSPDEWVHILIDYAIWGDDPLGRDIGGTKESVAAISREQMLDYLGQHYVPANTVIAIAGAIGHSAAVAEVERQLGDWRAAPATRWAPTVIDQPAPKVEFRAKRTEQAHVCIAVPAFSYRDPDRFALDLMNIMLGEGMSSRLFLEIRERLGLAYDVHSYVNQYDDTGSVVVYAGVDPKRVDETIERCLAEIERLRVGGVTPGELARSKEYWKGRTLLRMEDTRAIAAWIGSQEAFLGEVQEVDEVVAKIEAVTTDDIRAVTNRIFDSRRLNLAVVGPYRGARRFEKRLKLG